MSKDQNCGPSDLGQDGINSFFSRHRCKDFCLPKWLKPPKIGEAVYPEREGTTMVKQDRLPKRKGNTNLIVSRSQPNPILPKRPHRNPLPLSRANRPAVPLFQQQAKKILPTPLKSLSVSPLPQKTSKTFPTPKESLPAPEKNHLVVVMKYKKHQAKEIQHILRLGPIPSDDFINLERQRLELQESDRVNPAIPSPRNHNSLSHILRALGHDVHGLKRKRGVFDDGEKSG